MEHELEVTIKWENGVGFEITGREDDGPTLIVIKADEDGDIGQYWRQYTAVVNEYFKTFMQRMGTDMSALNG